MKILLMLKQKARSLGAKKILASFHEGARKSFNPRTQLVVTRKVHWSPSNLSHLLLQLRRIQTAPSVFIVKNHGCGKSWTYLTCSHLSGRNCLERTPSDDSIEPNFSHESIESIVACEQQAAPSSLAPPILTHMRLQPQDKSQTARLLEV